MNIVCSYFFFNIKRKYSGGCLRTSKSSCLHVREKARFGVCGAIPNRAQVHAKKEKARFDVCGATPTGHRHTPERKKQDLACAEPTPTGHKYTPEKKKQDLTCAEPSQTPSPKLQDEIFCKSVNLTQNYLLYK